MLFSQPLITRTAASGLFGLLLLLGGTGCQPEAPDDPPQSPNDSTRVLPPPSDTFATPLSDTLSALPSDTTSTSETDESVQTDAPGSCDMRSQEPRCYAFTGSGWTAASASAECSGAIGGVYAQGACPTANRIGTCRYRPDGDAEREVVYTFYQPMDPVLAEGICPGTFTAVR